MIAMMRSMWQRHRACHDLPRLTSAFLGSVFLAIYVTTFRDEGCSELVGTVFELRSTKHVDMSTKHR